MPEIHEDHCGIGCPQCQVLAEQAKALGGFAEVLQKMLDDDVFFRFGYEMARCREQAVLDAVFGKDGQ